MADEGQYVRRRQSHRKARKLDPLAFAQQREAEAAAAAAAAAAAEEPASTEPGVAADALEEREDDDAKAARRAQRVLGRKRKRAAAVVPAGTIFHELVTMQGARGLSAATPSPLPSQPSAAVDAEAWGLHEHLRSRLAAEGVARFFPVQRDVIPLLLRADASCDPTVGDVSVSAPTGSGKTLVYVLPIVHALLASRRAVRRLRALVLVPTRDLAAQVLAVFRRFTAGSGVIAFAATGQTSLAAEQAVLRFAGGTDAAALGPSAAAAPSLLAGCDVLVATPGRLVEHLDSTRGFTLRHLRFWVIDEADRLLSEAYQDWPRRVRESVFAAAAADASPVAACAGGPSRVCPTTVRPAPALGAAAPTAGLPATHAAGHPSGLLVGVLHQPAWRPQQQRLDGPPAADAATPTPLPVPFRVIVCSATLTSNPRKLASLQLRSPMRFAAAADLDLVGGASSAVVPLQRDALPTLGGRRSYDLPPTLRQAWAVCGAGDKPLLLAHLLRLLEWTQKQGAPKEEGQRGGAEAGAGAEGHGGAGGGLLALVFAGSVETAHRLTRTLQLFGGLEGRVVEFSTTLSQAQRTAVLAAARVGAVSVLVSSDVAARGLDLPSLPAVIHYDAPPRARTYVHRVGRAARAGRPGATFVILQPEQVRHFAARVAARMTGGAGAPVKETVPGAAVYPYAARFERVIAALRDVVDRERTGRLLPTKLLEPLLPLDDLPAAPRSAAEAWAAGAAAPAAEAEPAADSDAGGAESSSSDPSGSSSISSSVSSSSSEASDDSDGEGEAA